LQRQTISARYAVQHDVIAILRTTTISLTAVLGGALSWRADREAFGHLAAVGRRPPAETIAGEGGRDSGRRPPRTAGRRRHRRRIALPGGGGGGTAHHRPRAARAGARPGAPGCPPSAPSGPRLGASSPPAAAAAPAQAEHILDEDTAEVRREDDIDAEVDARVEHYSRSSVHLFIVKKHIQQTHMRSKNEQ